MCNKHVATGEVGYRAIHSQVQYSNRFDTTTATLRRIKMHGGNSNEIMAILFLPIGIQDNCCNAVSNVQLLLLYNMCLSVGCDTVKHAMSLLTVD